MIMVISDDEWLLKFWLYSPNTAVMTYSIEDTEVIGFRWEGFKIHCHTIFEMW